MCERLCCAWRVSTEARWKIRAACAFVHRGEGGRGRRERSCRRARRGSCCIVCISVLRGPGSQYKRCKEVDAGTHTNIGILLDVIATRLLAAVRLGPVVLPCFQVRTQVLRLTFIFGSRLGIHDLSIDNGYKKKCKKRVTAKILVSCPPGVFVVSCLGCVGGRAPKTRLGDGFLGRPPHPA